MTAGPVTGAQHMKQCVYRIPYDCGRCYTGKTGRPLEICIKDHKCNLMQGLLKKKIKISPTRVWRMEQNVLERSKSFADWTRHHLEETRNQPTSLIAHPISHPSLAISPIWTAVIKEEVNKITAPSSLAYIGMPCFYVSTTQMPHVCNTYL
jgi:hypothetical protein